MESRGHDNPSPAASPSLPAKPTEPDLRALRESFEREACLDGLLNLEMLRCHTFEMVEKILTLLRAFVERKQQLDAAKLHIQSAQGNRNAGGAAGSSLPTTAGMSIDPSKDRRAPDDEYSLKCQLCLYVEALYEAVDIGVAV